MTALSGPRSKTIAISSPYTLGLGALEHLSWGAANPSGIKGEMTMNVFQERKQKRELGRVSRDTKGPPGFHMEFSGQWNKLELSS